MPTTSSFSSPGTYTVSVPTDAVFVDVDLTGGSGGTGDVGDAGLGGVVVGGKSLDGSEGSIEVRVAAQGSGAGGGEATDIRIGGTTLNDRVAVAGGGGGSGRSVGTNVDNFGTGGDADGPQGADGSGSNGDGSGGTQTAGGAGGSVPDACSGAAGSFGTGGSGIECDSARGGDGGDGWYGGGGGGAGSDTNVNDVAAGGGGGSNYVGGLGTVDTNDTATSSGDGSASLTIYSETTAPTDVSQSIVDAGEITVSWTPAAGDEATEYRVQVSEEGGSFTDIATVAASTTSVTYAATPTATEHQFRVRAENPGDTSQYTTSTTVRTAPEGLTVTDATGVGVSLSWTAAGQADEHAVLRAPQSGDTAGDYTVIGTVSGAGNSFVDESLIDGGRAFYRVQALYTGGTDSAVSNQVRTRRPFFPDPAGLSLQSLTADSATLAWSDAAESESRYVVERRRDYPDGSFGPVRDATEVAPNTETATDDGVVPERLHEFQIRAERDEAVLRIDDSDATGVVTANTPVAVEFGDGAGLRFGSGDGQPIARITKT